MNFNEVSLFAAFAAGLISFMSPCVLPVLPVYVGLLSGAGDETATGRYFANTTAFLAGFTLVFVAMGATASLLGQVLLEYQDILRRAGALFIVFMGLNLAGVVRLPALSRDCRTLPLKPINSPLGSFVLGVAFTAGWTPCVGPILASVLAFASVVGTVEQGIWLLAAYASGFGLPFLVLALICQRYLDRVRALCKWLGNIQRITGIMLVLTGVLLWFNLIQRGLGLIYGP